MEETEIEGENTGKERRVLDGIKSPLEMKALIDELLPRLQFKQKRGKISDGEGYIRKIELMPSTNTTGTISFPRYCLIFLDEDILAASTRLIPLDLFSVSEGGIYTRFEPNRLMGLYIKFRWFIDRPGHALGARLFPHVKVATNLQFVSPHKKCKQKEYTITSKAKTAFKRRQPARPPVSSDCNDVDDALLSLYEDAGIDLHSTIRTKTAKSSTPQHFNEGIRDYLVGLQADSYLSSD